MVVIKMGELIIQNILSVKLTLEYSLNIKVREEPRIIFNF